MKKLLCIVICLTMGLGLFAACDTGGGSGGGDTPGGAEPTDITGKTDDRYLDRVVTEASDWVPDPTMGNAPAADLSTHGIIGSGMVLQRRAVNRIYGRTTAKHVAVAYKSVTYYGTVEQDGSWMVYLPPMEASNSGYRMTVYTEKGKLALTEIYVGEVFLCAGQSNMHLSLGDFPQHAADITYADDAKLRLCDVYKSYSTEPNQSGSPVPLEEYPNNGQASWKGADPASARTFSAVGYLFGKRMREQLNMPIGLLAVAMGGSGVVYWQPQQDYDELLAEGVQMFTNTDVNNPCYGYNETIHPIRRLTVRGAIWYQGETNAMMGAAETYHAELTKMIAAWRRVFDNPDMTFSLVGLPRWDSAVMGYSQVRTAMQEIRDADPLVCMSSNVDQGDWTDIHPGNKSILARRLADETLFSFFGKLESRYPFVTEVKRVSATEIQLTFNESVTLRNGSTGFEISTDGIFYNERLTAALDGKTLTIQSEGEPINYVRYAVNPTTTFESVQDVSKQVTVFNADGLPLDQFVREVA